MTKIKFISLLIFFTIICNSHNLKSNSGYYQHELVKRDTLTSGVIYSYLKIGAKALKHSVHIIEIDLNNDSLNLCVFKAKDCNNGLEKLQNLIGYYNNKEIAYSLASVNANFWRAISNYPIGPLIVNDEIVEAYRYKKWTSCFIDQNGKPYIDTFDIKTTIYYNNLSIPVSRLNRRMDSNSVVVYNRYAGNELPHISEKEVAERLESILSIYEQDSTFNDSTEIQFDTLQLQDSLREMQKREQLEYDLEKAILEFQTKPLVNSNIECIVTAVKKGKVEIPNNGFVVSYGKNIPEELRLKVGDIVSLKFETNKYKNIHFKYAVCGTPRLVRDGIAKHEAYLEGSRGRRFISRRLARTAIGYNKDKSKMYFVVTDANDYSANVKGADLSDLSNIMKAIGCWEAMNLDGGGSSYMTINNKNVKYKSKPLIGRKVSAGIGVIKIIE